MSRIDEITKQYPESAEDTRQKIVEIFNAYLSDALSRVDRVLEDDELRRKLKAYEEKLERIEQMEAQVATLEARLRDAEITVAKIGFCDPAPHMARERYERKHGSVTALESERVEGR